MTTEQEIFIVGAGTYAEAMCELAEILGYTIKSLYDEDESKLNTVVMGYKVEDRFSNLNKNDIKAKNFIVAIGNNEIRQTLMKKINNDGGFTPSLIHPSATVSPSAEIGKGVYIQANAYIWTNVKIDDYCIISPNVVIAHHSTIGEACLISTLSAVGASINIEKNVFIGMGSTIVTGLETIGHHSIIGAGAVVLKDCESYSVYVGVPAKKIRQIASEEASKR